MALSLMEGNEAIAWAAVKAGCTFFAGYPITPATTIYTTMLNLLPPRGGICLQGEDEIASIGFCLGASMAGAKAMTATSGPGLSLYSEQISFAIGSEIPLVIVDVQRLGPSTGSATKGADGDIQFMRWGNSAGQPVIVLAPVDVADCYRLTVQAFNLAETFRCPVFIASNKEIAMTRETLDIDALDLPVPVTRRVADAAEPFLPFAVPAGSLVPSFLPIGAACPVRQTSSTHGPDGYITADPETIAAMQERLNAKVENAVADFSFFDWRPVPGATVMVITYGVTARAAAEAIGTLDTPVALLVLKTLWPVAEAVIREKAAGVDQILVAEMNLGQYLREIQRILPEKRTSFLGRMDGELITPSQIKAKLEEVLTHA